ncbi:neutral/alkaline non-lysosomal ceramidase N-terminal domain-containing protein [Paenibacillus eucommiae]|uniref:Neutral/alkaline non-lysosomal ceramidase N-terminal domain-containing protein n=1 Tax=Paenibacillus eucommiae TaxID=1355755 RepID=A0ABS4IW69_9BACL|nr:neutral/alkaline non-lysosomal ceramidase N-terminal domain-containing protein [Paenibacillus eucommiae]MBP1991837.1 hypothetical protein [Paenibacillus eucommiae]
MENNLHSLQFGLAGQVITPEKPVFMHGYGDRTHKSEGAYADIWAKAVLLVANTRLLLVTIDALGSDRSFVVGIKDALQEKFGLQHEQVLINFSHTHGAVYLTGTNTELRKGGYSIGQHAWAGREEELDYTEDEHFYTYVKESILSLVDTCSRQLEEGELLIGRASSDFGVSRRKPKGDGVEWAPYYEGEIDKDLFVLQLADSKGEVKGILYNYGCHTTARGSTYLISGDFSGKTSEYLESAYPGVMAMFLQGCGGEIKPRKSAAGDGFKNCNFEEMDEVGTDLAKEVMAILENSPFTPVNCNFEAKLQDAMLLLEHTPIEQFMQMKDDPDLSDFERKAAERTIQAIENGTIKESLPLYILGWKLDEATRIIAIEGEVSTQYALMIKKLYGNDRTLVLGYSNGVFCYIPTRQMIREGGYEAECNYFFGLSGPFVPEIEDVIMAEVVKAGL